MKPNLHQLPEKTKPHTYKVIVAGNHGRPLEKTPEQAQKLLTSAIYLQDSEASIDEVRFLGRDFDWLLERPRKLAPF